jgi:hypothetical protein
MSFLGRLIGKGKKIEEKSEEYIFKGNDNRAFRYVGKSNEIDMTKTKVLRLDDGSCYEPTFEEVPKGYYDEERERQKEAKKPKILCTFDKSYSVIRDSKGLHVQGKDGEYFSEFDGFLTSQKESRKKPNRRSFQEKVSYLNMVGSECLTVTEYTKDGEKDANKKISRVFSQIGYRHDDPNITMVEDGDYVVIATATRTDSGRDGHHTVGVKINKEELNCDDVSYAFEMLLNPEKAEMVSTNLLLDKDFSYKEIDDVGYIGKNEETNLSFLNFFLSEGVFNFNYYDVEHDTVSKPSAVDTIRKFVDYIPTGLLSFTNFTIGEKKLEKYHGGMDVVAHEGSGYENAEDSVLNGPIEKKHLDKLRMVNMLERSGFLDLAPEKHDDRKEMRAQYIDNLKQVLGN